MSLHDDMVQMGEQALAASRALVPISVMSFWISIAISQNAEHRTLNTPGRKDLFGQRLIS